jgi:hypothetical protein
MLALVAISATRPKVECKRARRAQIDPAKDKNKMGLHGLFKSLLDFLNGLARNRVLPIINYR